MKQYACGLALIALGGSARAQSGYVNAPASKGPDNSLLLAPPRIPTPQEQAFLAAHPCRGPNDCLRAGFELKASAATTYGLPLAGNSMVVSMLFFTKGDVLVECDRADETDALRHRPSFSSISWTCHT